MFTNKYDFFFILGQLVFASLQILILNLTKLLIARHFFEENFCSITTEIAISPTLIRYKLNRNIQDDQDSAIYQKYISKILKNEMTIL